MAPLFERMESVGEMKALDLFCGAGGASMGLHQAGFEVTGVDINPQPKYPFKFIQADALTFDLSGFDFIWASPPCQAFTRAQRLQGKEHPDLIPYIRFNLAFNWIRNKVPYVIENVPGAPLINPQMLCGAMFEGLRVYRHRLFEASFDWTPPTHPTHTHPLQKMGRAPRDGDFIHVVGNFSGAQAGRDAMGIQWMTRDGLREAIPPAYSKYIAEQWLLSRPSGS